MVNLSSPAAVGSILRRFNLRPQRRLGQNFLIDANVLSKICNAADLHEGVSVLEIGPGLGVLTSRLAETVGPSGKVVAIEIDRALLPALEETLGGIEQVAIVNADALSVDFDDIASEYSLVEPIRIVANIPYQITSPLIAKFLEMTTEVASIVLLVQKEVATRLAAKPGTPEYGAFTLFVQYHASIELIGSVSPSCFLPAPEVTSAIIRLRPHLTYPVQVDSPTHLFNVIHAGFGQRRKTLLNSLSNDPTLGWTRDQALSALTTAGIDPGKRGETLSLADFANVANSVH